MHDTLLEVLSRDVRLTVEQSALITSLWKPQELAKNECFHRAGTVTTRGGFVVHGCLRSYEVDAEGAETTLEFAPERAFVGDIGSAVSDRPSPYTVEAIEPSTLLTIDFASFNHMLEAIPAMQTGYRRGLQRRQTAQQRRITSSLSASAEARYTDFVAAQPALAARVPQHMLASYLGITPETLSRIRRRGTPRRRS